MFLVFSVLSLPPCLFFFFLNDPAPPEIYPLPLPDALPISCHARRALARGAGSPRRSPRRARPPPRGLSTPASRRLPRERRGPKVDAEPPAPNRHRTILRQIEVRRYVVVLVPDVALQRAQVDDPGLFCGEIGRAHV